MRKRLSTHVLFLLVGILATSCLAFADTCSTGAFTTDGSGQSVCDLGAAPSNAVINGGTFDVSVGAPTGTGVFDPFLRIQQTPAEGGWNEDYKNPGDVPAGSDAKSDPHTHSLLLSNLATVSCPGGGTCYEFTLDLQQDAGQIDEKISLNNVQIFVGSVSDPSDSGCTGANFATCIPLQGDTLAWNMDGGTDSSVTLDSTIHQGNGTSNMTLFVPTSFFNGLSGNVIFYSQFGDPPGSFGSNSSFEEWAALTGENTPVPEPGSLMLLGTGLVGLGGMIRKRLKK